MPLLVRLKKGGGSVEKTGTTKYTGEGMFTIDPLGVLMQHSFVTSNRSLRHHLSSFTPLHSSVEALDMTSQKRQYPNQYTIHKPSSMFPSHKDHHITCLRVPWWHDSFLSATAANIPRTCVCVLVKYKILLTSSGDKKSLPTKIFAAEARRGKNFSKFEKKYDFFFQSTIHQNRTKTRPTSAQQSSNFRDDAATTATLPTPPFTPKSTLGRPGGGGGQGNKEINMSGEMCCSNRSTTLISKQHTDQLRRILLYKSSQYIA